MLKNDRPTRFYFGKPTYYNIKKVPCYFASRTEWQRRGYEVKKGEQWAGNVEHWQGREYIRYELFHLNQCREIAGKKAEERRWQWHKSTHQIDKETAVSEEA